MKKLSRSLAMLSVAGFLVAAVAPAQAQAPGQGQGRQGGPGGGRGNFDPAQMQERMMERYREQLAITNDDEWKIVSARIEKVMEARRATATGGGFGFGRGGRGPGGPGGPGAQGGQGGGRGNRGGFGPQSNPEMQALQKAIDDNASPDELKAKLAKVREARKANEEKLKVAQKELKEVLNTRQEAVAVTMGLIQ